jgi:hypothetical protein
MTPEELKKDLEEQVTLLRRSMKTLRGRTDGNTEAIDALTEQLVKFNDNISDFMQLIEQLIPLAEGAAAGNQVLSMVLPVIKGMLARRRSQAAAD